jgi:hypothetical protein
MEAELNTETGEHSGASPCSADAIQQAWHDYHGPVHTDEGEGFVPSMPPTFMRGFVYGFQYAEKLVRQELLGHECSELWGENGLLAAQRKCLHRMEDMEQAFALIAKWSQEDQDNPEICARQWRGCVAIARQILSANGGDHRCSPEASATLSACCNAPIRMGGHGPQCVACQQFCNSANGSDDRHQPGAGVETK